MIRPKLSEILAALGPRALPFADAASKELPLGRLLRLSLFQVSVGMALVLLNGTLNRVMIVELGVSAWLVSLMIALPLVFAPLRALIGFRSDWHKSAFGWRRVPYIWFGTMMQFGGFAILPFALLVLTMDDPGKAIFGEIAAAVAFLLVGIGIHTTQTAGLALANDLAPPETRPRVVALLYVTLLLGMVVSSLVFGALLQDFGPTKLVQCIQGAAVLTVIFNSIALWKQESIDARRAADTTPRPPFEKSWRTFLNGGRASRLLLVVGLGTMGFSMQDILLEPYGGQILHLSVGATTVLTALMAAGSLVAFAMAARSLTHSGDPCRLAALGALAGLPGFSAVILAAPMDSDLMFRIGATAIGFGAGLFAVGTLAAAMSLARDGQSGLALGAWGAVQATAAGLGIALGGAIRDWISFLAETGSLGEVLTDPSVGFSFVYHLEIALLFATLVAIGPLVRPFGAERPATTQRFGLAELPG
ncbi:MAG: BCD family MFS transporter [Alphaproteobacteria bacterium]|nr:BCD family MFS transporter [Alphaproteobacteria bacterium]